MRYLIFECSAIDKLDALKTLKEIAKEHGVRIKSFWEKTEDKKFKLI